MVEDKIKELVNTTVGNYYLLGGNKNDGIIGGWVFEKVKDNDYQRPNHPRGCCFILHQLGRTRNGDITDETFLMMVYNPRLVEKLKAMSNDFYVVCRYSLHFQGKKKAYFPLITELEITHILDTELDNTFGGKEICLNN